MKYKTFNIQQAVYEGCTDANCVELAEYCQKNDDYINGVFLCDNDGKPIKLVGTDGGEPEDQTLTRDWSWVVVALNRAYKMGSDQLIKLPDPDLIERLH